MSALPLKISDDTSKIIDFESVRNRKKRYNPNNTSNKKAGTSSEVFAFRTKEEIKAMIDMFDKHIKDAPDDNKEQIAYRNKLLFIIGINVGLRASDLRRLKWSFFYNKDGTFKELYRIQPKKQKKKFVTPRFNNATKTAISDYVAKYPIEDMESYVFASRKGNEAICESSICRIIKDAAIEAGINQNIGSHSLRKTWGFWCWHEAKDKSEALTTLQMCFNHSSTLTTIKYIGITDDEISDMYNSINLGLEFI